MAAGGATTPDPMVLTLAAAAQQLAPRIDSLEEARSTANRAHDNRVMDAARTVQASTETLFGSEIVLEQRQDPEMDERYTIVRVVAFGGRDEISDRYREWHRRLADWAPGVESHFRLAVEI